ncbi:BTB and MATH domain-containing protein 38-like [Gigantopelta aegis]|uniref:BTB and MATH domain-containing protein 38-like n=1 Tax=Gigantopelta aegis TaxID=1735272 RepID=UPI001B88CE76|nr:BTB and MATH domain-containing protein 38-like [Gigantopelta aegis]
MSSHKQFFFEEPDSKSDITLIVENRKLHLNKAVLSYVSPVFDRMFHGDFEEKTKSEISLPGKDYEKFVKFLLCVHPATLAEITKQNIDDVLPLADEYQVEQLKENCASFLERQLVQCCDKTKVNNTDLIHYMMLADNFSLKQPLETCLDIAAFRRYSNLEKIEEFKQISDATKVSLLSRRLSLIETPAMLMHKDMTQLKCTLSSAGEYLSCVEKRVYDGSVGG